MTRTRGGSKRKLGGASDRDWSFEEEDDTLVVYLGADAQRYSPEAESRVHLRIGERSQLVVHARLEWSDGQVADALHNTLRAMRGTSVESLTFYVPDKTRVRFYKHAFDGCKALEVVQIIAE